MSSFEGKRHRVRIGSGISRTVAREIASVKRASILKGEAGIGGRRKDLLFDKAVEQFLSWAKANKRPSTVEFFFGYCFKALSELFKGRMLSQIHPFLVEKHKQVRVAAGHRVAINRELAALSALFNQCRKWKKFEGENPVTEVERIDEPLNRLRFLTHDEEARLLEQAQEPLRTIMLLGIHAGLRIGAEALTLKKENVDLDRRLLTIEAAYSKNGETQTIPLNSLLIEPLRRRMQEQPGDLVFAQPDGRPVKSIRTAFTNACNRAKLSRVTLHTLRHTFASRLAMQGVGNRTLQSLGRWKRVEMIDRYAHLSTDHLAEAIELTGPAPVVTTGVTTQKAVAS